MEGTRCWRRSVWGCCLLGGCGWKDLKGDLATGGRRDDEYGEV